MDTGVLQRYQNPPGTPRFTRDIRVYKGHHILKGHQDPKGTHGSAMDSMIHQGHHKVLPKKHGSTRDTRIQNDHGLIRNTGILWRHHCPPGNPGSSTDTWINHGHCSPPGSLESIRDTISMRDSRVLQIHTDLPGTPEFTRGIGV